MRAKLVIPKGWRRLKAGTEIKKGDRIFNQFFDEIEWSLCLVYVPKPAHGFDDNFGLVMRGEKQTVIRRIGV